jgi:hypothetical protein
VTEDEVLGIGGENMRRLLLLDEVLPEPRQRQQQEVRRGLQGQVRPKEVIGDVTQAAYLGPWLWKAAVEKAGSFDIDKVAAASPGIELKTAPEGYVKVHENHHLWSKARIGQGRRTASSRWSPSRPPDRAEPLPQGLPVSRTSTGAVRHAARARAAAQDVSRARDRSASSCVAGTLVGDHHRTMDAAMTELWNIGLMQGFAGLSLFSVLLLMGLGLAIIFGQMGVINMAHGEFMTIGAYTIYMCSGADREISRRRSMPYYFLSPSAAFVHRLRDRLARSNGR